MIECCEKSTHFALLMNWQLEAYMNDLTTIQNLPNALAISERVYNRCLKVLLPDLETAEGEEDSKVYYPHTAASLVGIGAVLGSFGSQDVLKDSLELSMVELKQPLPPEAQRRMSGGASSSMTQFNTRRSSSYSRLPVRQDQFRRNSSSAYSDTQAYRKLSWWRRKRPLQGTGSPIVSLSLEELHTGDAFSFTRYLQRTGSQKNIGGDVRPESAPIVKDPRTRLLTGLKDALNFSKEPEAPVPDTERPMTADSTKDQHYFHSELQFINALNSICKRLVNLPKTARQSSLRAELALLNHNLPAKVCIPLWCKATSNCPNHHTIVRIVVSEAVVLNSAEKAPYLLLMEVIEAEHIDFDEIKSIKRKTALTIPSNSETSISEKDLASVIPSQTSLATRDNGSSGTQLAQSQLPPLIEAGLTAVDDFFPRMRTAAIMLSQLSHPEYKIKPQVTEMIKQRILKEMVSLEEDRMRTVVQQRMPEQQQTHIEPAVPNDLITSENPMKDAFSVKESEQMLQERVMNVMLKEDPSASVFKEPWSSKEARIRSSSPYGGHPDWKLVSVIVKSGSDLRQEQLACQLIREFQLIWEQESIDVWVYYYRVLITSASTGLIETIGNSISVHSIKKEAHARGLNSDGQIFSLFEYFKREFGPLNSERFRECQLNFARSLAAYSLITYILAIKDRHNGNILIDADGHIIHIDFGFMLSNSPGSVGFESAPFKLSQEYVDILGGLESSTFKLYKELLFKGFMALRKHADKIILLVEMMTKDSMFPCFAGNANGAIFNLRARFESSLTEKQVEDFIDRLIISSHNNMFTRLYDNYQYYSQGIL